MAFKIYKKNNYLIIEDTVENKQYQGLAKDVFIYKNEKLENVYDFKGLDDDGLKGISVLDILDEFNTPFNVTTFEEFYTSETGSSGAPGGGGAGDASAANQTIGNTTLASINTRVLPQSVIPSHIELLSNTSQTLLENIYKSISLIVMSGTINIDVDGVVINNFPTNYTETWGNGVGFITKPITITANASTRVVINLTK